jgi:pimeloyl-ACP methyl ester carboxylesterase
MASSTLTACLQPSPWGSWLLVLILLASSTTFGSSVTTARALQSTYHERLILANDARLSVVDWGGSGPVLLFMPGFGNGAHIFDSLAPAFVDHFHVLALTPRGFPPSSAPDSGYTIRQLAVDVKVLLDTLRATKAVLAGHSISGAVITRFAQDYPTRLLAAVYLDGAYDFGAAYRRSRAGARANLPKPADTTSGTYLAWKRRYPEHDAIIDRDAQMWDIDSSEIARRQALVVALADEVRSTPHPIWLVKAPALVVCATGSMDRSFGWLTPDSARWNPAMGFMRQLLATKRSVCEDAKSKLPRGQLVSLEASHYVFLDRQQAVIRAMETFLRPLVAPPH